MKVSHSIYKKGIMLVILTMILLVGTASAFDFDNAKTYDSKTKTATIKNAYGLGATIATAKLETPDIVYTYPGKDRVVAVFEIDNKEDYENAFSQMKFYNANNNQEISRSFKYAYESGTKTVEDYGQECSPIDYKNGTIGKECERVKVGTHQESIWTTFDEKGTFKKNKVKIAIITDVYAGDYVEWIPTLYGQEISEWALWTSPLATDFVDDFDRADGFDLGENWTRVSDDGGAGTNASLRDNMLVINNSEYNLMFNYTDDTDPIGCIPVFEINMSITNWSVPDSFGATQIQFLDNSEGKIIASIRLNSSGVFYGQSATDETKIADIANDTWWNIRYEFDWVENETWIYLDDVFIAKDIITPIAYGTNCLNTTRFSTSSGTGLYYGDLFVDYIQWGGTSSFGTMIIDYPANTTYLQNITAMNYTSTNVDTCWYSLDEGVTNSSTVTCGTNFTGLNSAFGNNTWTVYANSSTTGFNASGSVTFEVATFNETSLSYNATSYETSTEDFILSLDVHPDYSGVTTAYFYYNETQYTPTITQTTGQTNISYSGITIGEVVDWANSSISFQYLLGDTWYNSSFANQSVGNISLDYCVGVASPVINFTFADEETDATLDAKIPSSTFSYWIGDGSVKKSMSYTNNTNNTNYEFCVTPSDIVTIKNSIDLKYSSDSYPQRTWVSSADFSNATTRQVILDLLSTSDGVSVSFNVQNTLGNPLSEVTVLVEKETSGSYGVISSGLTDDAGIANFWLNPDYNHRLTFSKTGYESATKVIRPTESSYVIQMGSESSNVTYNSSLEGKKWSYSPAQGAMLTANATYTFSFNITSTLADITSCQFELYNSTTLLATATGCSASGGVISTNLEISDAIDYVIANYSINLGTGLFVVTTSYWDRNYPGYSTGTSFWSFTNRLSNLNEFFGKNELESRRTNFSKIILFFFIVFLFWGAVSYSGWDAQNPDSSLIILTFFAVVASFAGFLTINAMYPFVPGAAWINKYIIAVTLFFIMLGKKIFGGFKF